jgi:hypothetical protein
MRRVERRVHQDMIGGVFRKSGSRELRGPCAHVKANRPHARRQFVARGVFVRERRQARLDFNERNRKSFDTASEHQPGRSDAGAKLDRLLTRPRRRRRRKQHCVMAKAMAAKGLPQNEFAAEKRVVAGRIRCSGHIGRHIRA